MSQKYIPDAISGSNMVENGRCRQNYASTPLAVLIWYTLGVADINMIYFVHAQIFIPDTIGDSQLYSNMVDTLQTKLCFFLHVSKIFVHIQYIPDTIDGSNRADTGRCRQN